jgi:hypothetical protein
VRVIGTFIAYAWLFGGMAYYLVRFSRSFYIENEAQIRRAAESLLGG